MTNFRHIAVFFALAILGVACSDVAVDGSVRPSKKSEKRFGISVGASASEDARTRVEFDGVNYSWSAGENVGFWMAPEGSSEPVMSNIKLTGTNTEPSRYADFGAELFQYHLAPVKSTERYDYYSYYPYSENLGSAAFPNVPYTLPSEITVQPDVFPYQYTFMYSKVATADGEQPMSWVEGAEQFFGKDVSFQYRHAFAYLEVYLALNLMSQPVTKLVVSTTDGTPMAGTAHVNMETGAMRFAENTSTTITVNIGGTGLDINSATDYSRVWIPINPALAGKQFKFEFFSAAGASATQTVTGGALQGGKKHKASFKLPFQVNFSDLSDRSSGWSSDAWRNIDHKGYAFKRWNVNPGSNFVGRPFGDGHLTFSADDGVVYTPAIKLANSLGMSGVNVKVTFNCAGNDVLWWPYQDGNRMKYGITKMDSEVFMGEVKMDTGSNVKEYSFTGTLTAEKPYVIFKANVWGAYYAYMEQIKIEPAF